MTPDMKPRGSAFIRPAGYVRMCTVLAVLKAARGLLETDGKFVLHTHPAEGA